LKLGNPRKKYREPDAKKPYFKRQMIPPPIIYQEKKQHVVTKEQRKFGSKTIIDSVEFGKTFERHFHLEDDEDDDDDDHVDETYKWVHRAYGGTKEVPIVNKKPSSKGHESKKAENRGRFKHRNTNYHNNDQHRKKPQKPRSHFLDDTVVNFMQHHKFH
jgi:hypothetical protein